jgi:TonB family protein
MLNTLLASKVEPARQARSAAAAVMVHLVIIVVAIRGTATSAVPPKAMVRDTIPLEITRSVEPQRERNTRPAPPGDQSIPAAPPRLDLSPPALNFEPPRFSRPPLDMSALARTSHVATVAESANASRRGPAAFTVTDVDELPRLQGDLNPQYPEVLQRTGVSGTVRLEYVISPGGRVDANSIRVVESTHPAFSAAAIKAVRDARFTPAHRRGQPVAVLVRQTIRFINQ